MKFLITVLFGLFAYSNAQSDNLDSINIGPVHAHAQVGNLSDPYVPLTDQDITAQNNAIHFVEWSRTIFENGFGPVPPLDPYRRANISNVVVNFPDGIISAVVELTNMELRGSKTFILDDLTVRVNTSRVDYTFHIAEYDVEVDYNAHISIDTARYDLKGHMRLNAGGVSITGASQATIDGEVFQLEGMVLDIQADNVKVDLQNAQSIDINSPRSGNSNPIINVIANATAKAIAQTALLQTNEILNHLTVAQVMAILLPDDQ